MDGRELAAPRTRGFTHPAMTVLGELGYKRTMLIFRQMFDAVSSTYTYLLADSATREAVLIDPVFELVRRDGAMVEELGLKLGWTLETHVHADHVTGAALLRKR